MSAERNADEETLEECGAAARGSGDVAQRAKQIAGIIRSARGYRWVGVYEVTEMEIVALGWTGSEAPAHIRFAVTRGLSGDAVRTRSTIITGDVTKDSRYLAAFGNTRSEIIVPVKEAGGNVVGTIDVESERLNAFGEADKSFLQKCAERILPLFEKKTG